jgi:nucleoside-diphosphate-sugar epimerase
MSSLLVTGGAGYIGGHAVNAPSAEGAVVAGDTA